MTCFSTMWNHPSVKVKRWKSFHCTGNRMKLHSSHIHFCYICHIEISFRICSKCTPFMCQKWWLVYEIWCSLGCQGYHGRELVGHGSTVNNFWWKIHVNGAALQLCFHFLTQNTASRSMYSELICILSPICAKICGACRIVRKLNHSFLTPINPS